jgi:hypothetical protein
MAGSLAARVLAERFEQVVVIERDALPLAGEHRRGVRHGLHPRGREIPGGLFPGFTASLTASGAVRGDLLGDARWQLSGHQLRQADIGLPGLFASGPFLDGHATSGRWFKRRCAWSTPTCHGCTPPLAAALARVIGLKDRPEGLLRPDRMPRVLRGNLASGRPSRRPPIRHRPRRQPGARRNQRGNKR